jgi:dTDP-D-glucose 4,6-dehydratase
VLATGSAGFISCWLSSNPHTQASLLDALIYAGNPQNPKSVKKNNAHSFVHGDLIDSLLAKEFLQERAIDVCNMIAIIYMVISDYKTVELFLLSLVRTMPLKLTFMN